MLQSQAPSDPRTAASRADLAARRQAFAQGWSLEATRPTTAEVAQLQPVLRAGAPVYLSAVPAQPRAEQVEAAARLRAAGFEPIPHLGARRYASRDELTEHLEALQRRAQVRRVLLIGGDVPQPAGPFPSALAVIESGLLQRFGIGEIGLAGYPAGHPAIPDETLDQALADKLAAAAGAQLRVHIVTQFCFEAERIVGWLAALRAKAIAVPVKVGLVGPTSIPRLLRYARRCGVAASARGLMRTGAPRHLVGQAGPDPLLEALLSAPQDIGEVTPHFFSFGGVVETARYARDAAERLLQPREPIPQRFSDQ